MSASPAATADTSPEAFTVATDVADELHDAWLVTVCVDAFDSVAFATNCAEAPTAGVVPVTATAVTVGADAAVGVGAAVEPGELLPHAHNPNDINVADKTPLSTRRMNHLYGRAGFRTSGEVNEVGL